MNFTELIKKLLGGRKNLSTEESDRMVKETTLPPVATAPQAEDVADREQLADIKSSKEPDVNLIEKLKGIIDDRSIMSYHYSIGYSTEDWDCPIENNYYEGEEYSIDHHLKVSGIDKDGKRGEFRPQERVWNFPAVVNSEIPFGSKNRGYYASCFPRAKELALSLAWAYIDVHVFAGKETITIRIKESDLASVAEGKFERLRQWLYDNINSRKKVGTQAEVDQLPGRILTREELRAMPERTEIFSRGYGASVTKGEFSCWEDGSIERDIWAVDAYELMNALNVETLDDLFKVIKERFSFDTIGEFMKENNIHFAAYAH